MEIERKFLVRQLPNGFRNMAVKQICQSYLSFQPTIRIRKSDEEYFLTIKGRGHVEREEFELPLSKEEYGALRQKTEGKEVRKKRYFVPLEGGPLAELDIYEGELEGLFTVEVEFSTMAAAEAFQPPQWFGSDVSVERCYKNTALALYGKPVQ